MNCFEKNGCKNTPASGKPCWEEHQCGRETAGVNAKEFGVCPAYKMNLGNGCWVVYGTLCGGEKRTDWKEKADRCSTCSTFLQYDAEHKDHMRREWIDFDEDKPERGDPTADRRLIASAKW